MLKGKKRTAKDELHRVAGRRCPAEGKRYRFVIPVTTWAPDVIQPMLSLVCPRSEMQLDPRANREIVGLLVKECLSGSSQLFTTFNENDAFSRITDEGNQHFGGISNLERELAQPLIARSYLDLIKLTVDEEKCDEDKEKALTESLLLPDARGIATTLRDLYSSAPLPSDIPGLHLPPLLHADLATHPLLRRRKWRRQKYTMTLFLGGGTLQTASDKTRKLFWKWLRRNERLISPRDRPKLADIAIWPDGTGRPCRVTELCDPRSRRVAEVLADIIRRPHEQVRRSRLVSAGRNTRTSIRRVATGDEITRWLDTRMAEFKAGEKPDAATADRLGRFEDDLVILLKDKAVAPLLKSANVIVPALAQDGSVQLRTALVMPNRSNDLLQVPGRFMLKARRYATVLGVLWPASDMPTATMLLAAFSEDRNNFSSLQSRLQHFLGVTAKDDVERLRLAEMPIIPVNNRPHAPSALAFAGRPRDYWGSWKTRIWGSGLSQDDQRRYREVGVISSIPNSTSSRSFFRWLSCQDRTVVEQHIPCVLRHILHRDGPTDWAESFTDTPFIPVRGRDGLQLVSLRTARRTPIFLSDAGEVGDAVVLRDGRVRLVVDRVREVTEPISGPLRSLGVRSLREELKEPRKVTGSGGIVCADKDILARFRTLRSFGFRRTFLKRLSELDIESKLVRHDWQDRLSWIKEIWFADEVEARHQLRSQEYSMNVDAGLDRESGIFWVRQNHDKGPSSIYEAIAQQLVFKSEARRIDLLALEADRGIGDQ